MTEQARGTDADDLPTADPAIVEKLNRLIDEAQAHWQKQALAASVAPLRQALKIAEESLGADDPYVAWVLSHLGWLAARRGQVEEAISDYRRVLAIYEHRYGSEHFATLRALEDLAGVLFQAHARDEEADALALRAIAGYEAVGRDDTEFASLIGTLGWRRYWIGRYAEAEPMLLRALEMQDRLLGPTSAETASTAQQLAMMYDHRGFANDPEPYYRKALAGFEADGPEGNINVFEARYRLADYFQRQGREAEAAPLFDRLVTDLTAEPPRSFAPDDQMKLGWLYGRCCQYLRANSREAEAEWIEQRTASYDFLVDMSRREAEHAERAFGPDSIELAEKLEALSAIYVHAGQADEAEEAARRRLAILQARLGPDDPATIKAAGQLACCRDQAIDWAKHKSTRQSFDSSEGKPFDFSTAPWRDERRSALIRNYLKALEAFDEDEDDPTGAVMAVVAMSFMADLDEQWEMILDLIAEASDDASILQAIAAGPLESFLSNFDEEVIEQVEAEAARDPKFHRVLSGVWKLEMSDPVWNRVRVLQAKEPNPLPEMRPFDEENPKVPADESL